VVTVAQRSRWQATRVRRQLAPEPVPISDAGDVDVVFAADTC
jgi:hypothetical protein